MTFKPRQASWFETYTPRDQTVFAIEALAETGRVELSHHIWSAKNRDTYTIRRLVSEFSELARRFENDLPAVLVPPTKHVESPEFLAESSLKNLRKWSADLLRMQRDLKRSYEQLSQLELLKRLIISLEKRDIDFGKFIESSHLLYKKVFACPPGEFNHPGGENIVVEMISTANSDFLLILGTPEHRETIEAAATFENCTELLIPEWLSSDCSCRLDQVSERLDDMINRCQKLETELAAHKENREIKEALASVRLLNWYLDNICAISKDHKLCHIVGWTSADSAKELEKALKEAGIEAVVMFSEKPLDELPPVNCNQPWWLRPFSFFVDLLGTPGSNEIDPTPLLALVVPLLFGYMFPDVGHGLILALAGLFLGKKIPAARLLVPCGLAGAAFGVVFGDVFGRHDVIEAIWLKPLDEPLLVLLIPLITGALLITIGLVFSGIEASWRGELVQWLQTDVAVLLLYLTLIATIFWHSAFWLLIPIMIWFVAGSTLGCSKNRLVCLGKSFGLLFESAFRLVLNSFSFVRVGAFALAHAGTSFAANQIAGMIDNTLLSIVFLVFSHLFIIVLEGLVVFVQTSRLILFEFFIRFLKAEGRVFKPEHGVI